jgi:Ca2+-binding RTX toxin-like protein
MVHLTRGHQSADGTAEAPSDYAPRSGTLTFSPGQTRMSVEVPVEGDALDELDERFFVSLSDPANATVADGRGTGTIQDDDAAPSLSISDDRVTEGSRTIVSLSFVLRLSAPSAKTVSFGYATQDGSASAPSDYAARSGTLTFAPGQAQKTVSVPVRGDMAVEPDEAFLVELSEPTNTTISDRVGRGTIADDDECTITGTGSSDSLIGTARRDVICALRGDDTVLALGGDDVVRAGRGGDTVRASSGADTASGGGGDDLLTGGDGEDNLVGDAGQDLLSGQGGDDRLDTRDGSGGDTLDGGPGTDVCRRDGGTR